MESIKKDFEKASKVYRTNCDDFRYGKSCLKFGHYSFLGKGEIKNVIRFTFIDCLFQAKHRRTTKVTQSKLTNIMNADASTKTLMHVFIPVS